MLRLGSLSSNQNVEALVLAGFKFDYTETRKFRNKSLARWKTRSKPPERNLRISEEAANRSKEIK